MAVLYIFFRHLAQGTQHRRCLGPQFSTHSRHSKLIFICKIQYIHIYYMIFWVAQGSRPRCGPRHMILHSNIVFYAKLFATINLSWNSLKCILWHLLELSDSFIKNENSALPILIEKNWKNYFCLENEVYFFKEGKSNFFRLNLDRDYRNHFLNFM